MHHPDYLTRVRELCDASGAFLIADEIAVGFGRTGTLFASEQSGVMPDLLCLSKGLTGGFMPLAAVLATQAIYDGFLDDSRERAFLHSHSYTGNPLACAAARVGLKAYRAALARGVVLRPLGDVLYWMPPYCVDEEQLQLLADVTRHAIEDATACA